MKIVVLGGGISSERQVSLATAVSVCSALRSAGHKAVFIDSFFGLEDYSGSLDNIFDSADGFCKETSIAKVAPDLNEIINKRKDNSNGRLGNRVLDVCKMADCVFIGLHGNDGEDGRIQAMFDLLGIRYTGSGPVGSAIGMDKSLTKQIMICNGIPTPPITKELPCVVKEVNGGSSIGTWICKTTEEYDAAVSTAKNKTITEKFIPGREFSVPVLDNAALDVIEIVSPDGNFDYVSKYQNGDEGAKEICPAPITLSQKECLQSMALKLHNALGLNVYSRSDFILDEGGNFWCLEINTLPGMTANSLIPKSAKVSGIEYVDLCERIVNLSLKVDRYQIL